MVLTHFAEEGIVRICHNIVKAYAGAYENLFYTIQTSELSQQRKIVAVIHLKILTRLRKQALPVSTDTLCKLFVACRAAEICSRSADIMNITLEVGVFYYYFRLLYN